MRILSKTARVFTEYKWRVTRRGRICLRYYQLFCENPCKSRGGGGCGVGVGWIVFHISPDVQHARLHPESTYFCIQSTTLLPFHTPSYVSNMYSPNAFFSPPPYPQPLSPLNSIINNSWTFCSKVISIFLFSRQKHLQWNKMILKLINSLLFRIWMDWQNESRTYVSFVYMASWTA